MDERTIQVKQAVYQITAESGTVPNASEVARRLELEERAVLEAFDDLAGHRLLVLEPGDRRRIRMAPPFSGVPTDFRVRSGRVDYHANCVWDALGIPAALGADAVVDAHDGHTRRPTPLEVRDGAVRGRGVAHFAVPAAHWWDDIVHT